MTLSAAAQLRRRYYLVQKAREVAVFGVLIEMLSALTRLIRARGRKHYVFLMGKLNAAKLANFTEVGAYVLLGSSEHSLVDSRDFYRPVVTPYELLLALSTTHEWSGEYVLDYAPLLPRLAAAATAAEAAGGGGDSEDEAPDHSLVSGRLFSAAGAQERRAAKSGPGPQLAAVGGALVARGCHDLSATS